ncbi:MAG TPA: hypothetical protein VLY23_03520 [Candidatus Acidoferrum sp.]|nr:hypothetical protein [Candidatus Acidoferrum sp.]
MNRIGLGVLAMGMCLAAALPRAVKTNAGTSTAEAVEHSPARQTGNAGAPQPAADIQALVKALAGRWTSHEKYEPLFMTPNGGVGTGEQVFRAGPGGFTLLEDYHSKTPAGELFGTGIVWWDQPKGQLQHLWCINVYPDGCEMFPPPPQPGPQWDGKKLVIHIESEQDGKKMVWLEILSDITANSFTQTADIGEDGGPLRRWFTTHAVRQTGTKRAVQP